MSFDPYLTLSRKMSRESLTGEARHDFLILFDSTSLDQTGLDQEILVKKRDPPEAVIDHIRLLGQPESDQMVHQLVELGFRQDSPINDPLFGQAQWQDNFTILNHDQYFLLELVGQHVRRVWSLLNDKN